MRFPGGPIAGVFNTSRNIPPAGVTLLSDTCGHCRLQEASTAERSRGSGLGCRLSNSSGVGTQDLAWTGASNPGVGGGLDGVADVAHYQTSSPSTSTTTQYNGRMDANVTQKRPHSLCHLLGATRVRKTITAPARAYNLFNHVQINDAYSGIWSHIFFANAHQRSSSQRCRMALE